MMARGRKPCWQRRRRIGIQGYAASLELRKLYQILPDAAGARLGQIRVIDESGEDYLYPEEFFVAAQAVGKADA